MNLISKREIVFFIGLLLACTVTAEAKSKFKPFVSELMRGGDEAKSVSVDVTGVKVVYLSVTVGPDNYDSDQAIWAEPKLIDRNGKAVDLTTVKPTFHKVGWGRLFINTNQNKQPLRIADERFTKGFWAHGPSVLQFDLGGKYVRFEARVGIDTGAGSKGSVVF